MTERGVLVLIWMFRKTVSIQRILTWLVMLTRYAGSGEAVIATIGVMQHVLLVGYSPSANAATYFLRSHTIE